VARGLEHLDGVAEQEPVALPTIGDPDPNCLARKGMAHEDHATLITGHAVAAVGNFADLRLEVSADQRLAGIVFKTT
jgi:hypothetical protein